MKQKSLNLFLNNYLDGMKRLGVSEESIQRMRDTLKIKRVKTKSNLLIPGDICQHVYLIAHGGFICRYIHEVSGEANTINFYLPDLHPVMACLDSYFTQIPTNCELKAVTDSAVIALPKLVVDDLNKQDPFFASFYKDIVITALMEENELKTKLIAYSSKEKYDFILDEMPSVIQAVPAKYIAEFCGISPAWLSKLKKKG